MKKSETLNLMEVGENSSSGFTRKSGLSPGVESKWRQFRDYDTDSTWGRSCLINDPESYGKIKRYYMLRKALFGPKESMDRVYKSFVDKQISGFTNMDRDRMATVCTRVKLLMPFTDIDIDGHLVHARRIFKEIFDTQFRDIRRTLNVCLDCVIVNPTSRPQTIYGYKETPIIIVPSLENIWDLLVLIHEEAHAVHLRISSQHNDMGRFIPDELVTEVIANSFQFVALKYIADKWGVEIANQMWFMLLLFGLDDNVHYSKKKATLLGLVLSPQWAKRDPQLLYNIMKSGDDYGIGSIGGLAGYKSEREMIDAGLKIAEAEISF